ncbi:sensor histidine kinase [Paenibacillus elgii]|uniref:sensor histidine kinase n=1 Tax=Paenibacillus elgii TaxID=189691 RepID=UPI001673186B|nr:GHKL domain-containing protein [Paenibacillus elgii]
MKLDSFVNTKRLKVSIISLILIILVLSVINSTYYNFTRNELLKQQVEKMKIQATNIKIAIELSQKGEKYVEGMVAQNLRTVSLYAQSNLDPDIEKVSNEKLKELSQNSGIDHITLLKRSGDDIIGYRSSDPKEIGMSSKRWGGHWFRAFHQLFEYKQVVVPQGEILPNFWAGPWSTSSTDPSSVDKWGYYYDGTTNYIIDPYVHDKSIRQYQKDTGVDATIEQMIKNTNIVEVTVFNSPIFLKEKQAYQENGQVWYEDREVLFGKYNLVDHRDAMFVKQALDTNVEKTYETMVNGTDIMKTFFPLNLDAPVVVGLVTDLSSVNSYMNNLQIKMVILIGVTTIVALVVFMLISRYYTKNKEAAVQSVQEVFVGNMDQLFTTLREQRHDFNNHMATINSLVHLKEYEELNKYTKEIVGEITIVNDIINIKSPALSALIQAKITQALKKRITLDHHIINMEQLSLGAIKSTDLVKIISNLIDNAFEAVETLPENERYVELNGCIKQDKLYFSVYNTGTPIPSEQIGKMFEKGFSTKKNSNNSGLGLFIVQRIIKQYKGKILVMPMQEGNKFEIIIPL